MNGSVHPPRRGPGPLLALATAALLAWSACDLSDSPETRNYVAVRLPDSVRIGDWVEALLKRPGDTAVLDVLWNRPLASDTDLSKLPAPHYDGGDADLYVSAWQQGLLFYRTRAEIRKGKGDPKLLDLLPPDSLAPKMKWQGPDSLDLADLLPDSALAALYPDMACQDDRDRGAPPPALAIVPDTARPGIFRLEYRCRDRSGNASLPRSRRLRILSRLDTVPPVLTLPDPRNAISYVSRPIKLGEAVCADAKDPAPRLRDSGTVDFAVPGEYSIRYECIDASGNAARETRVIRVKPDPDTVKPVITWRGTDTLRLFDGEPFPDTSVDCADDRDGAPRLILKGLPGTLGDGSFPRGRFQVKITCIDSSNNLAELFVSMQVARRPDPVPPVISLRGPDSLLVYEGDDYADSGAACSDDRDGLLPVQISNPVDMRKRGEYRIAYACSDSAGNAASTGRKVRVARRPDADKPIIVLKGPDTALVYDREPYRDSGALCLDARDGMPPVEVQGTIDTGKRGLQMLYFACVDSAGNAAHAQRAVRVARRPDNAKPVIALRGPDSLRVWQGSAYADSGATCMDNPDGALPVRTTGAVNTALRGRHVLTYDCIDSAGNAADPRTRVVSVFSPDTTPPVIALLGPDSILAVSQAGFIDPGGNCSDSADGALQLASLGIVGPVTGPGWYRAGYACTDGAGNTATAFRAVRLGLPGTVLPAVADVAIDTLDSTYNWGASQAPGFVAEPNGRYFSIVRFDLASIANRASIKSAKLHFFGFLQAFPYAGGFARYTFKVYHVKSDWAEGTGDWFYHDGGYRNGGETWYQYYPISDSMKTVVTNPSFPSGLTGSSKALVRDSALVQVAAAQSDSLYFGPWCGNPNQIPSPNHLTPVELDITDYIKTGDFSRNHGFVVKVWGQPTGMQFSFTSRETGGAGAWAPRLLLEY